MDPVMLRQQNTNTDGEKILLRWGKENLTLQCRTLSVCREARIKGKMNREGGMGFSYLGQRKQKQLGDEWILFRPKLTKQITYLKNKSSLEPWVKNQSQSALFRKFH
ncbi:hypothetical protein CEXT_669441 [Caerostris extrusa]|uniref:Uncharacterized protein n=1 Tax=Caerostris extrusa TaxID=172846 RepID=A0AAV4N7X3_CAEEX|nr:hypothetical protein CEXT_669441 [Caerostris extrusa]